MATDARSCEVTVTFRSPNGRSETAAKLGRSYARLYERLYDEDESMMIGRHALEARLDVPRAGGRA